MGRGHDDIGMNEGAATTHRNRPEKVAVNGDDGQAEPRVFTTRGGFATNNTIPAAAVPSHLPGIQWGGGQRHGRCSVRNDDGGVSSVNRHHGPSHPL